MKNNKQTTKIKYCGIDICKTHLDVWCDGKYKQYPYKKEGVKQLIEEFKSKDSTLYLIYESTGRLSANLHVWIRDYKVAQSMLNPAYVRYFAKALKIDAKTDKLDAKVLVIFAQKMQPEADLEKGDHILELQELLTHMELLIANRTRHKIELRGELRNSTQKSAQRMIEFHNKEIKKISKRIITIIRSHKELKKRYEFYIKQAGIGERGAMTLVILMPELGYLNRGQVASLIGVAPFNYESGAMKGKRSIKGGRKRVRSVLYLCVLTAIRMNNHLKSFYQKGVERGKNKRSMLIACIRKWVIHLNSELKKESVKAESVKAENVKTESIKEEELTEESTKVLFEKALVKEDYALGARKASS